MMGARGVALGLGKINLNDLSSLPLAERKAVLAAQNKKMAEEERLNAKPKIVIRKRVDRQTLWAACRAVVFGCVLIALGTVMTVVGYFAESLSIITAFNETTGLTDLTLDKAKKVQFDSLAFIGPVVMGVGAFILMIACVMTLESRDKHAQIIHEYPDHVLRRRSTRPSLRPTADGDTAAATAGEHQHAPTTLDDDKRQLLDYYDGQASPTTVGGDMTRSTGVAESTVADALPVSPHDDVSPLVDEGARRASATAPYYGGAADSLTSRGVPRADNELLQNGGGKYPSTSCLDSLVNTADPRALLRRFLDDQSRAASQLRRSAALRQQSNSLDVPGSDLEQMPHRPTRSEEMPIMHSTVIAEVHHPPSASTALTTTTRAADGPTTDQRSPSTKVPEHSPAVKQSRQHFPLDHHLLRAAGEESSSSTETTAHLRQCLTDADEPSSTPRIPATATLKRARRPGNCRPTPSGDAPLVRPESIIDLQVTEVVHRRSPSKAHKPDTRERSNRPT